MKKHLLVIFILTMAITSGDSLAGNSVNPVENTKSSQETISPASYQDEHMYISYKRAYHTDSDYFTQSYYCIELEAKVLSDHKILRPSNRRGQSYADIKLMDNFGNSLGFNRNGYQSIKPCYYGDDSETGLRPGETKAFTLKFTDLPLSNTEYLILKIPQNTFGNIDAFELRIENFKPSVNVGIKTPSIESLETARNAERDAIFGKRVESSENEDSGGIPTPSFEDIRSGKVSVGLVTPSLESMLAADEARRDAIFGKRVKPGVSMAEHLKSVLAGIDKIDKYLSAAFTPIADNKEDPVAFRERTLAALLLADDMKLDFRAINYGFEDAVRSRFDKDLTPAEVIKRLSPYEYHSLVKEKPLWISILVIICIVLSVVVIVFAGVLFYRRILPKITYWALKGFQRVFSSLLHVLWFGIIVFTLWCIFAAISEIYIRVFLPIALAIISLTIGGMYTLHKKSGE